MGGTFDPVHFGHLAVAEEVYSRLSLTEVVFVPAGHPYFKAAALISPAADRVRMLKLALADKPHFKISLLEIERPGPSYAVDTILKMREEIPEKGELFFIMGWDNLMALPLWQDPERLIAMCRIAAVPRPGYPRPDISLIEKDLPGISRRAVVLDKPFIDISATEIRERVRKGLPVDELVPGPVAEYISRRGLYKNIIKGE